MNIVHPSHVAKKLTTFCNHMSHAAFYIVSGAEVNSIPRKRSRLDHAAELKVCKLSQECFQRPWKRMLILEGASIFDIIF